MQNNLIPARHGGFNPVDGLGVDHRRIAQLALGVADFQGLDTDLGLFPTRQPIPPRHLMAVAGLAQEMAAGGGRHDAAPGLMRGGDDIGHRPWAKAHRQAEDDQFGFGSGSYQDDLAARRAVDAAELAAHGFPQGFWCDFAGLEGGEGSARRRPTSGGNRLGRGRR